MSGSEVYETVGTAVFVKPGRAGGNVHVRPRPEAPGTTCGRPIRSDWTNLPPGPRPRVCGWCLTTCASDERYGFRRVVKVQEATADDA